MSDLVNKHVSDLATARRRRKASADARCVCGNFPAVCSPMGRPCCYRSAEVDR